MVSRLTTEIEVIRNFAFHEGLLRIDRPNARERESAKFDANRRA